MKTRRTPFRGATTPFAGFALLTFGVIALSVPAYAQNKKNPASKVYISDLSGEAQIDTGDAIQDISKRSVYTAQGTVIETKKPENENDQSKYYSTMVYSNGTGAFFDADTRVEVKRFVQEPFMPNRADVEVEPSISQTQAFIARGAVGLCTSKLVAGSSMTYQTSHGSINIRGRKLVIETTKEVTKVSMLEGDSTVKAGAMDMGGHTIHAGEQAIIRQGKDGQPNSIQISRIPDNEATNLDEKVSMACMAKKTVYFEVREQKTNENRGPEGAAGAANENAGGTAGGDNGTPSGPISAFDDATPNAPIREIVPVVIVPINLPRDLAETPSSKG